MSGQVIALETRVLPAGTNIVDLNTDTAHQNESSHPTQFTEVTTVNGQRTFFTYNTPVTNKPILGVTQGTTGTTTYIDVRFSPNTQLTDLIEYNGELYFFADDGVHGKELWKSDGTAAGTVMVKDIVGEVTNGPSTSFVKNEGSNGAGLMKSGGKLYFTASDDTTGHGANRELWVSDGTANGTFRVADINPGAASSNPTQLTDVNGVVYFEATSGIATGRELWKYDPNTAQATLVEDIRLGAQSSGISELTAAGNILYFSANDGTHGYELWRSDGTEAGTFMISDIQPEINGINQGSNPSSLLFLNGALYFAADDGAIGKEFWRYDPNLPVSIDPLAPNPQRYDIATTGPNGVLDVRQNSSPKNLTAVGTDIFFSANDGLTGRELWKFDTTNPAAPPVLVRDINTGPTSSGDSTASSYPGSLLNVNGVLYFVATETYTINGQTNFEIWRSNGTALGTQRITETNTLGNTWQAGPTGYVYPKSSADGLHPTELIQDLSPDRFRIDANNNQLVFSHGQLFFAADNGFNGTTAGGLGEYLPNFEPYTIANPNAFNPTVFQLKDLTISQLVTTDPFGFTQVGARTYFFFTDTRLISRRIGVAYVDTAGNVVDVGLRFDNVGAAPVALNGNLYFIAQGSELWETDGTAAGTVPVHQADVSVALLTLSGTRLFFRSDNNATGSELWTFDGATASLVRDIGPVVNGTNTDAGITFITPGPAGTVYFNANDNNVGSRLWFSNGTNVNNGTRIAIPGTAAPGNFAGANGPAGPQNGVSSAAGIVYFTNAAGNLFRSNGADAGSFPILDATALPTPTAFTGVSNLTPVSNGLYFTANGGLWFTDGTANATPVAGVLNPQNMTAAGSRLFFTVGGQLFVADTGVATLVTGAVSNIINLSASGNDIYFSGFTFGGAQELWFSNGTAGGTFQVADINPTGNSSPRNLKLSNGRIFFAANDGVNGHVAYSVIVGATFAQQHLGATKLQTADSNARDFLVLNNTVYFFTDVGPNRSILSGATTVTPGAGGMIITQFGNFSDGRTLTDTSASNSELDNQGEYLPGNNTNGIFRSHDTASATRAGTRFLFFTAVTGERTTGTPSFQYGTELYVLMNGVPTRIGDIRVASTGNPNGNANPRYLTSPNNNSTGNATYIVFAANGTTGTDAGLWRFDTSQFANAQNTWQPTLVTAAAVNPRYLVALGNTGKIYFTAGAENARTAWVYDGSTATQLSTAIVDESAGDGKIFGFSNGNVYFSANGGNGFELYQANVATNATTEVLDINPGSAGSRPGNFKDVNGVLYFAADDGVHGFELWRSNGTAGGTQLVQDIEPGPVGSNPGVVITTTSVTVNGVTTTTTTYSYEGFAVANTRPDEFGVTASGQANSGANNGTPTLLFSATTSIYGRELWQVTPNSFDTTIFFVKHPTTGAQSAVSGVSYTNNTLVFTYEGLTKVIPGVLDPSQPQLFFHNGLFYSIQAVTFTGVAGQAQIVKDIAPGVRSSNPLNLTAIDGTVYFSADDGLSGDTLWRSIGLDQLTANTQTVRLHDDGSLFLDTSTVPPGTNGYRNPGNFTLLTTQNTTLNRLLFTASNDIGGTELYNLAINHTPLTLNLTSNAVPENQPQGTLVGNFITTDPDPGDTFQYQFVAGAGDTDNGLFQIVGTSLQIRGVLNFEEKSSYSVRIRTTDQRGQFFERNFTINVADVNEKPTGVFLQPGFVPAVVENTLTQTNTVLPFLVGTFGAVDQDTVAGNNQFSISGPDAQFFEVIIHPTLGAQLWIKSTTVLDFETKPFYTLTLEVLDPTLGGPAATSTFVLNVIDVNEFAISPTVDSDVTSNSPTYNGATYTNAPLGSLVGITALATDQDLADVIFYSLDDNAGGRFRIDPLTGVVSVLNGALLNHAAASQHTIIVRSTSTDGTSTVATFNILVNDIDSEIFDLNPAVNTVPEHSPVDTVVGLTAFAFSNDGVSPVTYSLADNAGGRFKIDPLTGVVTVASSALLDREVAASWDIIVQASSTGGPDDFRTFTIAVTDINDHVVGPITDIDPTADTVTANGFVVEHSPIGTLVGIQAFATDDDVTNNTITYSLTNDAGGRFTINSTTGVVSVANSVQLDYDTSPTYTITVQARSSDNSTITKDFVIALSDVNEFDIGPVFDNDATPNSVDENSVPGTTVGITAKAIDQDGSAIVTYSLVDDAGGRFQINPSTGLVSVLDGSLLNREAPASAYTIRVRASSDDGTSSEQDFIIALNDVNEFPVGPISNVGSGVLSIPEHSPIGTQVGVTAFAADPDATNNTVTYILTDSAGGAFAINALTGVVTVAKPLLLDRETQASYSFTVVAKSSDGSQSPPRTFTITMIETNDHQVSNIVDTNTAADVTIGGTAFNGNVNEKAPSGTVVGITAFATDGDFGANNQITYSLQDTSNGRYKIDPVTGIVTVDDGTRIDYETGASNLIVVKATSGDGSFKTRAFVIKVNDIFEEPTLVLSNRSVNENMAAGAVVGVFGVQNAAPSSPVYTLVSGTGATNNKNFQIVGNQLRTRTKFNFETKSSYSVRVRVTSANGITTTQVFTINVLNVNEAPTSLKISKTSVKKSSAVGTLVGLFSAVDPDAGQSFNYTLVAGTGSTDNAKFRIVGNQLQVNAPLGTGSRASIRVRVTDQNGLFYEKTISIKLTT